MVILGVKWNLCVGSRKHVLFVKYRLVTANRVPSISKLLVIFQLYCEATSHMQMISISFAIASEKETLADSSQLPWQYRLISRFLAVAE